MRLLRRLIIFWLIAAPLFWFFGMPLLLDQLSAKAQSDNAVACRQQLLSQHVVPDRVSDEAGANYCYCLSQALHFTRDDLFEMVQTRQASQRVQTELTKQIDLCTPMLETRPVAAPSPNAPIRHKDGSIEYHL